MPSIFATALFAWDCRSFRSHCNSNVGSPERSIWGSGHSIYFGSTGKSFVLALPQNHRLGPPASRFFCGRYDNVNDCGTSILRSLQRHRLGLQTNVSDRRNLPAIVWIARTSPPGVAPAWRQGMFCCRATRLLCTLYVLRYIS